MSDASHPSFLPRPTCRPLSVPQLGVIWFERTLLSLFLTIPIAQLLVAFAVTG